MHPSRCPLLRSRPSPTMRRRASAPKSPRSFCPLLHCLRARADDGLIVCRDSMPLSLGPHFEFAPHAPARQRPRMHCGPTDRVSPYWDAGPARASDSVSPILP